jgi:CRISPR-associated protein Cst1
MLIKASSARIKRDEPPLIGFDEFITIFEDGEELPRIDWRLARDLVLIRMIEQLHEQGWMARNKEVVPEEAPEEQAAKS